MASRTSAAVRAQVTAMLALVERTRPGALDRLRGDALTVLGGWPEIQVQLVPEVSPAGEGCSVAGSYDDGLLPPALRVAESSWRRRQFTVLHEYGHHLQNTDIDLGTAVIGADGDRLEDDACDLFAASVLLPDSLVDGCFGDQTPTPGDIVALYRESSASRAACLVRAVDRLTGFGTVMLCDSDGVVSFAAAKGSIFPPARGSDQSGTALVAAALSEPTRQEGVPFTEDHTTIRYRSGHHSNPLFGQAAWCDGYLIAVLVDAHAPWQSFSLPRQSARLWQSKWAQCEVCRTDFEMTDTCGTCGEPRCPSGHCPCIQKREQRCTRCNLTWALRRFPDGGSTCEDCL